MLLERYITPPNYHKLKIIKNKNSLYKEKKHIIKYKNKYITEKDYLNKRFGVNNEKNNNNHNAPNNNILYITPKQSKKYQIQIPKHKKQKPKTKEYLSHT